MLYCDMSYVDDCKGDTDWYVIDDNMETELCERHARMLRKEAQVVRIPD
jgi:hypothetical protein